MSSEVRKLVNPRCMKHRTFRKVDSLSLMRFESQKDFFRHLLREYGEGYFCVKRSGKVAFAGRLDEKNCIMKVRFDRNDLRSYSFHKVQHRTEGLMHVSLKS